MDEVWLTRKETLNYLDADNDGYLFWLKTNNYITFKYIANKPLYDVNSINIPKNIVLPTCGICGKQLNSIKPHIFKKHGLTATEYKKQFPGHKLIIGNGPQSEEVVKRRANTLSKNYQQKSIAEKQRYADRASKTNKGRKHTAEAIQNMKNANRLPLSEDHLDAIRTGLRNHYDSTKEERAFKKEQQRLDRLAATAAKGNNIFGMFTKKITKILAICEFEQLTLISAEPKSRVYLKCNNCTNEFSFHPQIFGKHKRHHRLCPFCYPRNCGPSKQELEVLTFIESIYTGKIISSDRTFLLGKEIDIYLPELKIGFEYTGIFWHSTSSPNNRSEHHLLEKRNQCELLGLRLFTIFESDWVSDRNQVEENIRKIINNDLLINVNESKLTLDKRWYHIGHYERVLIDNGFTLIESIPPQKWLVNCNGKKLIPFVDDIDSDNPVIFDCGYDVWVNHRN